MPLVDDGISPSVPTFVLVRLPCNGNVEQSNGAQTKILILCPTQMEVTQIHMVVFAGELLEVAVSVELFRMWLGRSVDVRFFFHRRDALVCGEFMRSVDH